MPNEEYKWFVEHTSPGTTHSFGVKSILKNFRTKFQQVEIVDTVSFGRALILDGKIQSSEYDEYIYHEALVHPVMLMCPDPRCVLVIGGGEGATLREVLRHPMVEKLVMVDLDQEVVEHCQEYLANWHQGSFEDRRVELVYADARDYLKKNSTLFDVIISDVPEPVEQGPALKLFTKQYFNLIKKHLSGKGVFSLQAGDYSLPYIDAHCAIYNTIQQAIPFVRSYRAFVPSFNTEWGFIIASSQLGKLPSPDQFDKLIETMNLSLKYFDGETSSGMFSLPRDIRKRLKEETRVIDDQNLLTIY
ncbi:MAG: fused MFS/spermidine synthase [Clostridia bacterium]|nr:fused MFS/spermidine synthase [Clostridia bacterium]